MSDCNTRERLLAHAFAMMGDIALGETTLRPLADRAGLERFPIMLDHIRMS